MADQTEQRHADFDPKLAAAEIHIKVWDQLHSEQKSTDPRQISVEKLPYQDRLNELAADRNSQLEPTVAELLKTNSNWDMMPRVEVLRGDYTKETECITFRPARLDFIATAASTTICFEDVSRRNNDIAMKELSKQLTEIADRAVPSRLFDVSSSMSAEDYKPLMPKRQHP